MKIDRHDFYKLKSWLILATYIILLIFALINIHQIIGFFQRILGLAISLFYATGIAYVLNIPMSAIEKMLRSVIDEKNKFLTKKIRTISIIITYLLAFLILYILLSIILPQVFQSIQNLIVNLTGSINYFINNINTILEFFRLDEIHIDPNTINMDVQTLLNQVGLSWDKIIANVTQMAQSAGTSLLKNFFSITSSLANWFMGFLLSFYLLSSKEKFIRQGRKLIAALLPVNWTKSVFNVGHRANQVFNSFVSGQLVEACILGTLCYIGMMLLNFPFAMLISVVVACTAIIPMFGAMIGMAFGCILILSVKPIIWVFGFILYFQTLQQFEGNVIYPKVVGNSVGLPGIWVLLSIVIFGGLYGMFGMLIAVPSTAVLYAVGSDIVNYLLSRKKLIVTENALMETSSLMSENSETEKDDSPSQESDSK